MREVSGCRSCAGSSCLHLVRVGVRVTVRVTVRVGVRVRVRVRVGVRVGVRVRVRVRVRRPCALQRSRGASHAAELGWLQNVAAPCEERMV